MVIIIATVLSKLYKLNGNMKMIKSIFNQSTGYIICSLLILSFSTPLLAKKKQQHELSREWMYKKSNIYITAHPAFSPAPKITSFINPYHHDLKLTGVMNFNFGFIYMYNLNKNYGISIGLYNALVSFKVYKYRYYVNGDILKIVEHKPDDESFSDYGKEAINHSTTFPIRFIYRKEISKKIDFNIQCGLDLQLQRSFYYETNASSISNDSTLINLFKITLENNGKKKFNLIPYFGFSVGINQLLKNNHYINYQFSGHIPFINPYTNGKFSILPNTPYESIGTFKLNPMSFGLEVNYVFTFNRRKLRKERQNEEIHYFNNNKEKSVL